MLPLLFCNFGFVSFQVKQSVLLWNCVKRYASISVQLTYLGIGFLLATKVGS